MDQAKDKIKVAFIATAVEFGGSERVNLNLLKNIDRNKFHISAVLLIRPWEKENFFIQELEKENYPVYTIPVAVKNKNEGRDYFRVLRCCRIMHSILKTGSFDLVHTHGYFADVIGIPATKMLHIPHLSTCHGFISNNWKYKLYNKLDHTALRFVNKIIAVSDAIKRDLIENGINESRIAVIPNAVDHVDNEELFSQNRLKKRTQLNIHEKDFVVGYIGRLSEEKGVKYLIKAGMSLKQLGLPVKVLIIGEGSQRKELEDLVKQKGMKQHIIFTGFQADIENWLPALDIFVLPSLTEGTPMALLEAMAFGIPVIASRVGGVPQVIDSETSGILVSPGKPDKITEAVHLLYKNEHLRNSFSREAQKSINLKYNIRDWIGKIESEYLMMQRIND